MMGSHEGRRRAAGQTLAIFALTLPVLVGLAGLGADGGNVYLHYRNAQSAADLAALAGARLLPNSPSLVDYLNAENRALSVASSNGYASGVTASAPYVDSGGTTHPHDVEVLIDSTVQTYFLPLFLRPTWDLSVRAVAGSAWSASGGTMPAVFAGCDSLPGPTCPDSDKAIEWSGSDGTVIGGVVSACGLTIPGSNNTYTGGATYWDGCSFNNGGSGNNFVPSQSADPVREAWPATYVWSDFNCNLSNPDVVAIYSGKLELKNYYQAGTILEPGIYCATGSSAEIVLDDFGVIGNNVTLVAGDQPGWGTITISGSNFNLAAFHSNKVVMWANGSTSPTIKISGSDGTWNGIIYARYGQVEISGQSNLTVGGGSILADRVKIAGSNTSVDANGLSSLGPATLESLQLYE